MVREVFYIFEILRQRAMNFHFVALALNTTVYTYVRVHLGYSLNWTYFDTRAILVCATKRARNDEYVSSF